MSLNKFTDLTQKKWMDIHCNDCICDNMQIKNFTSLSEVSITNDIKLDHVATPTIPESDKSKIYVKPDGNLYILNDVGTETKVGDDTGDITALNTKCQNISILTSPNLTIHSGILETDVIQINTTADMVEQLATPVNPVVGENKLYFKNDQKLYSLDSSGTEQQVGGYSGSDKLSLSGGTMTGGINMGNNTITNCSNGTFTDLNLNRNTISLGLGTVDGTTSTHIGNNCGGDPLAEQNVVIGNQAGLGLISTSDNNILMGTQVNCVGDHNIVMGSECAVPDSGNDNIIIGRLSGAASTAFSGAVIIGSGSGISNVMSSSVLIGQNAGQNCASLERPIVINSSSNIVNPTASDDIIITTGVNRLEATTTTFTHNGESVVVRKAFINLTATQTLGSIVNNAVYIIEPLLDTVITLPLISTMGTGVNFKIARNMLVNPSLSVIIRLQVATWNSTGFKDLRLGTALNSVEVIGNSSVIFKNPKMVASMKRSRLATFASGSFAAFTPFPWSSNLTAFPEFFTFTSATELTCNITAIYTIAYNLNVDSTGGVGGYTFQSQLKVSGVIQNETMVKTGNFSAEDISVNFSYPGIVILAGQTIVLEIEQTGLTGVINGASLLLVCAV